MTIKERPGRPGDVVIRGVRIFDGARVLEADSIGVRGGVIEAVGVDLATTRGVPVVHGAGAMLVPGLIDSHVHALHPENLAQALAFGVTTELDMFCPPPHLQQLRQAAAARHDVADFRSAGIGATAPGGHPTQLVTWGVYPPFPTVAGPDEVEGFVAARVGERIDYFKVFVEDGAFWGRSRQTLSEASVRALVAAAHARGLRVLVHADTGTADRSHD